MSIALRSIAIASFDNNVETLEVNTGAGMVDDDVMYMVTYSTGAVNMTIDEPDWNKVGQAQSTPAIDITCAVFLKRAVSESGTYTLNIDGGVPKTMHGIITVFSGVSTGAIQDGSAVVDDNQETTDFDPSPVDTATDGAFVVTGMSGGGLSLGSPSKPSGYTWGGIRASTNNFTACAFKEVVLAGTENPGPYSSFASAVGCCGITLSLKPEGIAVVDTAIIVPTGPLR